MKTRKDYLPRGLNHYRYKHSYVIKGKVYHSMADAAKAAGTSAKSIERRVAIGMIETINCKDDGRAEEAD